MARNYEKVCPVCRSRVQVIENPTNVPGGKEMEEGDCPNCGEVVAKFMTDGFIKTVLIEKGIKPNKIELSLLRRLQGSPCKSLQEGELIGDQSISLASDGSDIRIYLAAANNALVALVDKKWITPTDKIDNEQFYQITEFGQKQIELNNE